MRGPAAANERLPRVLICCARHVPTADVRKPQSSAFIDRLKLTVLSVCVSVRVLTRVHRNHNCYI